MNITKTNSNTNLYFDKSLFHLKNLNYNSSITFIDLAIKNSRQNTFYMFQKTKILFLSSNFSECSLYIKHNLKHFYKTSSLYIFSELLSYYIKSSKSTLKTLENILESKNIPSILAYYYKDIIAGEQIDFLKNSIEALKQEDYLKSKDYSKLTIKNNPNNPYGHIYLGKSYCFFKKYKLAIKCYQDAQALDNNICIIHYELGIIMLKLKEYPSAIEYFQECLKLNPNNSDYRYYLGESFYKWRKFDSALMNFKKISSNDPLYKESLFRIADIYTQTNKVRKSKKYYTKALKLNDNSSF